MVDELNQTERLIAEGDEFANAGSDEQALDRFQAAWNSLPDPREDQELAIRVLGAIADCQFRLGEWDRCRQTVEDAFRSGADLGNSFLRLRLGQSLYELGHKLEAANWLVPAYLSQGRALFEEDDPKYLEFFRDKLESPPGGWPEGW